VLAVYCVIGVSCLLCCCVLFLDWCTHFLVLFVCLRWCLSIYDGACVFLVMFVVLLGCIQNRLFYFFVNVLFVGAFFLSHCILRRLSFSFIVFSVINKLF
jgi:hypothetical protein